MTRLTKTTVDAEQPTDKERFVWDSELKGFGLKIFPTGAKSFVVQYRTAEGRTRRYTVGKYSSNLTADQARKIAKGLLADVTRGADPQAEVKARREAWTVNQLLDAYLASPAFADKADSTRPIDLGRINHHLRPLLGSRFADQITSDDIKRARTAITDGKTAAKVKTKSRGLARVTGGAGTADKAVLALRAAYTWAIDQGHLTENPAARIKVAQSGERDTIIDDAEVYARLFGTVEQMENEKRIRPAVADAIRLIALTGARRGEASRLIWKWVDMKARQIVLPPKSHKTGHKTGKARIIALPAAALEIIARQPAGEPDDYVFKPAKGIGPLALAKPWERVRQEAELPENIGLHGLRHSVGSHMAMNGASLNEIMEILGHRQASTSMRYIHFAEKARSTLGERAASVAVAGLKDSTKKPDATESEGEGQK
ncbi:DUF4102 domain-containing protein [Zoogloea oleivorans]|uniref:DUF4102 domain-containing protein n=1 Tax=Zoogloea oleivorans TaxID=1552750 RepID=A0A6C2D873_9RHOO|nr:site-specific integrase [Zoogloea oleivorans]TYC62104.1 DUF4102 domain-containing protein [Zoogloea oleivorans]